MDNIFTLSNDNVTFSGKYCLWKLEPLLQAGEIYFLGATESSKNFDAVIVNPDGPLDDDTVLQVKYVSEEALTARFILACQDKGKDIKVLTKMAHVLYNENVPADFIFIGSSATDGKMDDRVLRYCRHMREAYLCPIKIDTSQEIK